MDTNRTLSTTASETTTKVLDNCPENDCQNNGKCVYNQQDGVCVCVCTCPSPFSGKKCEIQPKKCKIYYLLIS